MIHEQDSIVLKRLSGILTPFIQLFALYVIMHGHSSPGGGFQGGVILGASFILLAVSFGIGEVKKRFPEKFMTILTSAGVFLYAGIGLVCVALGANYLDYSVLTFFAEPRSIGMLGIEIGVGITVMAVMVSIFHDLITYE